MYWTSNQERQFQTDFFSEANLAVLTDAPEEEVRMTVQQVADALRSSKRGSAAGLSGAAIELHK